MSMIRLALINFKNSFRNYLSLILSLAFTILVLFNFQNLIDSEAFEVLGSKNQEYVEIIVQVISVVLGCFMFFFLWYSTNVFLTRRKKEIGIYVFMGLSNEKIGKMYLIEMIFIGLTALVLGLVFGGFSAGLFQMILLAISDITVEIRFRPGIRPMGFTAAVYGILYVIFAIKGYVNIARSSVLAMMAASRQNEFVKQKGRILAVKAALGLGILCRGYALAVKEGGVEVMANAFLAVILVIVGVYLLFGGLIPLLVQALAGNKRFLYQKQRILWVNSMIFRMKKNYRTYAMVCVLMLCSVTALATGFAMKGRYDSMIQFENTYTFQLISDRKDVAQKARAAIERTNQIISEAQIPILGLDRSYVNSGMYSSRYAILPFSDLKQLAQETGLEFGFEELKDDEVLKLSHVLLASFITARSNVTVDICGKTYRQVEDTTTPYLGYLQESMSFYVVSDREYERIRPMGQELYTCHYRIGNLELFAQTRDSLDQMIQDEGIRDTTGRVAIDPDSHELDWVKVAYSICIFMFLVFILASGSIMFMKQYHDAFEEKERYGVMRKLGFDKERLKQSIYSELGAAYGITFLLMGISSFFSVKALSHVMKTDLILVNLLSVAVVFGILAAWYLLSVWTYEKNVGLNHD